MNRIKKGFLTAGIASAALISTTVLLNQTSVDAASATANSGYGQVELWSNINGNRTRESNSLTSGSSWGIGNMITASDGQRYYKVGGNEYASVNQMDTTTENSKQKLTGDVKSGAGNGNYVLLYTNPLKGARVVKNRGLMKHTEWYTDQRVIVNGEVYYRVATNEWTKGSDSQLISEKYRGDKVFLSNSDQRPYLDVPYSLNYENYSYTLLLKSNGEYLYNLKTVTNNVFRPGINYQKGTYTVNPDGSIEFGDMITKLYADWGNLDAMLHTTPGDVHFTGQGSDYPASGTDIVKSAKFKIVNNGSDIKGNQPGIDLKPQAGLSVTDPSQIGPSLYSAWHDSKFK